MSKAEIIETLESLRLLEEHVDDNKKNKVEVWKKTSMFNNDPMIHPNKVPFLLYDEDCLTVIDRTTNAVNEGKVNPFTTNWMEVTLYETEFVRQLLDHINSEFIMDVAEAIDDEDAAHQREDGQITIISSDQYGTGQGNPFHYSYSRDNWNNNGDYVSAKAIAEGILDKRNKAEEYQKKINEKKNSQISKHIVEIIDEPESHLHINMKENIIDQSVEDEINALKKECEEWKRKYEEAIAKEPEKAFNATGNECFTKAKMGLLIYTIASVKDGPTPIKARLVSIISAIGGWEPISVGTEMKKAGFNQSDIDAVAKLFEDAMPNFALEVRKQIARRPKIKK